MTSETPGLDDDPSPSDGSRTVGESEGPLAAVSSDDQSALKEWGLTRRELLGTVGLGAATGLAGCQDAEISALVRADDEHLPFDVWEEIRAALRTSPDHLPARAEQLVEEGDPEAIFRFVRNEIATYPTEPHGLNGTDRIIRWGVHGTLRGGAGTPREKAELLATLYRQAGFDADVLVAGPIAEEDAIGAAQELLWHPIERPAGPEIEDGDLDDWNDRLGLSSSEADHEVTPIDTGGQDSRALGETLLDQLPRDRRPPREFDWRWGRSPIVRVTIDGEEHYANLVTPNTPFGEPGLKPERLDEAPEATEPLPVSVTLSAATADTPEERFDLVSGEWSLEELVGCQLLVQTLPGIDPFERPDVTFRDIQTFLPALTVQAIDAEDTDPSDLSVMGETVTRAGDRLTVDTDGAVRRNGEPFVTADPEPVPDDIADVNVTADSSRYPEIRLEVRVQDSDGASVEELPATAFEVEDEGQGVGVAVTTNRAVPRVTILSDTSLSMPNRYLGEEMDELVDSIRERILETYPDAAIDHRTTNSDLWTHLHRATSDDANLIVYATDGHVTDELTPEIESALSQGPPAIMLSVFDSVTDERLLEMAELTGGAVEPASDYAAVERTIMDALEEHAPEIPTYVMTYGVPATDARKGEEREVAVHIGDANGEDRYSIPDAPAVPDHLAGLYLSVSVGEKEVTRTLAGYDPVRHHEPVGTQALVDDVSGALFGNHVLAFEAAAPPVSVWFDDLLGAKLSSAGLDAALEADDEEEIERQQGEGLSQIPPEVFQLMAPLPDAITDQSLTFQTGPRVVLFQQRPVFGEKHVIRHADLLPFAGFATAAADPEEGFRRTLETTARLAVVESAMFKTTTGLLLADASLQEYGDIDVADWSEAQRTTWDRLVDQYSGRDYQLLPDDGSIAPMAAFWNVDYETGEVMGILEDGSGGGTEAAAIREQIEEIDRVISLLNLLISGVAAAGSLTGPGAFALGIVAAYGQTLVRLYGAAALAIAIMNTSELNDQIRIALMHLACNVAKSIVFALSRDWLTPVIENLMGATGVPNPLSCPG